MTKNYFDFRIEGAATLERALAQLTPSMSKAVLRKAAQKALKPVLAAASANASTRVSRSGKKRKTGGSFVDSFAISTRLNPRQKRESRKTADRNAVNVYVGSDSNVSRLGHLIEFGTYKMAARPVLRPAWDANKKQVYDIFIKEIAVELNKAASRLAAKAQKGTLTAAQKRLLK